MNLKEFLKRHYLIIIFLLATLVISYYSYTTGGIMSNLVNKDLSPSIEFIQSFGAYAAIILILLTALEVILAPVPPLILYLAGGVVFGTFIGGTLILIGNLLGSVLAFYIGRKYGRDFVESRINKETRKKFRKFSKKYGAYALFFLRVNPLTSTDLFSYLSGISRMSLKQLLLGTALGLAPMIYIQTYIGADLVKTNPFLSFLFIWIGIAYLIVFIYWLIELSKKKKNT